MRITNDYSLRDRCAVFLDDDEDGNCVVLTPGGATITLEGFTNDEVLLCPIDGKEIFYPAWAQW